MSNESNENFKASIHFQHITAHKAPYKSQSNQWIYKNFVFKNSISKSFLHLKSATLIKLCNNLIFYCLLCILSAAYLQTAYSKIDLFSC